MTNGPLDSLPALEMRLGRQVANNCQELEPTITRERGSRGYRQRDQTFQPGLKPDGLMAWWPGLRFNILTFSICFTEQNSRHDNFHQFVAQSTVLGGLLPDINWKNIRTFKQGRESCWIYWEEKLRYEITLCLPREAQWWLLMSELGSGHYQLLPITLNQAADPA